MKKIREENLSFKFKKLYRYICIYGVTRALVKTFGIIRPHVRLDIIFSLNILRRGNRNIFMIGAGYHAYTSIAYYVTLFTKAKIRFVYDTDFNASETFASAYGANIIPYESLSDSYFINSVDLAYIASNHSSHAEYASLFIKNNVDVYIEKPLALNMKQLGLIAESLKKSSSKVYAGYNRPYSKAILKIRQLMAKSEPLSLSCAVVGHLIPSDHWYRDVNEGSRVVSNMGHWIDLFIHLLSEKDSLPNYVDIIYTWSNSSQPSDNVSISLVTSENDLANIFFTSRSEPFEGVNETIVFQQGNLIAKIDDFRSMSVWINDKYNLYKYKPKDNGHKAAVLQPFKNYIQRPWNELQASTMLMLEIEKMVLEGKNNLRIYF